MLNRPADDEVRSVVILVATFVAVTLAFGIAPPVLSVTVPAIVPSPSRLRLQWDRDSDKKKEKEERE